MRPRLIWPLLLAAALAAQAAPGRAPVVRTGIDVLAADGCRALRGRRVGLIANHTARTADGRRTIDVLYRADGVHLLALFAPEHGPQGVLDERVGDSVDGATGLPVHSLYGATRAPTAAMLQGLDTLVFDVQDVGCRFYTYLSTMRDCLEAAAAHGLRFCVLDRPNPIDGAHVEGPVLADDRRDFTGAYCVPVRHGMTAGELAKMAASEAAPAVDLAVVPCAGWRRQDAWDRTGLCWIDPSPNLRSVTQALLYPGIGLLETTNLSVGRGTDRPFELLGAPWCDGVTLAAELRRAGLPGVTFVPVQFTPSASRWRGECCSGVNVVITDWRTFEPLRTGVHVACALRRLYRDAWDTAQLDALLKHAPTCAAIRAGEDAAAIVAAWQQDLESFRQRRQPFLLYE